MTTYAVIVLLLGLLIGSLQPALAKPSDLCDRSPAFQKSVLRFIGAEKCERVTSQDIASLEELELTSWRSVETALILPSDFDGFHSLRILMIENKGPGALRPEFFRNLPSLERLDLANFPGVTTFPVGLLENSTLGDLPESVFSELSALQTLYFFNAGITSFANGRALTGLGSLKVFQIRATPTMSGLLTPGMFASLTSLERLIMMENGITTLPAGVFTGLPNLILLNLTRNRVTAIDKHLFASENFPRNSWIWLGFSELSEEVQSHIRGQHGDRVAFDCGSFSLSFGWEFCPI